MAKAKKGNWVVQMRCVVLKEVVCEDCTEDEASDNPFDHAVDERELDQIDYEVTQVNPNE